MKKLFIFSFITNIAIKGDKKPTNCLVLFFPYTAVDLYVEDIQIQLRDYFFNYSMPDQILIICFKYNQKDIEILFKKDSSIYSYIPKFQIDNDSPNLSIYALQNDGNLLWQLGNKFSSDFLNEAYRRGMVKIFNKHGGLILSQSAHHFVFPSGKHCDRFLRTGNVLINGSEVMFIASAIVMHFKEKKFSTIYCDTSSINSLAYAFIAILKELNVDISLVHVESFGSYEMFEKAKFKASRDSLFLISSSTSGSIIARMTEENKVQNIELDNIAVIYGLSVESRYNPQIICQLDYDSEHNPNGLDKFVSFNVKRGENCRHCDNGSTPLKVEGDVFLLEKPNVKGVKINVTDQPAFLKNFSDYYRSTEDNPSILRTFYKEGNGIGNKKYEVYINVEYLFSLWPERASQPEHINSVFKRLYKFVQQNIPASLKYIIVLPDVASTILAHTIVDILKESGARFDEQNILKLTEIEKIDETQVGVIAVISSSIVTGDNLLFLSRELRRFEKTYRRMYFTFLTRTKNKEHQEFLEVNLGFGEFGKGTHKLSNVEAITCTSEANATPWHRELDFVKELQEFCDNHEDNFESAIKYCHDREEELNNCGLQKGLENNLFFRSFLGEQLKLNNGFAFAPSNRTFEFATQSEVYFIISSVLNEMRNKRKLDQSEFLRHLIEPGNFVRYNDGIIQASLLRAATSEELKFSLSEEMSLQMKAILGDMIFHLGDAHSEAINEFFYAIAIKKLRLPDNILKECISLLEDQLAYRSAENILHAMVAYVKETIFEPRQASDSFKDIAKDISEMKKDA